MSLREGTLPGVLRSVSIPYGPYLAEEFSSQLQAGETVTKHNQKLIMADAEWSFGHVELRSEGFSNTWETPTLGSPDVQVG